MGACCSRELSLRACDVFGKEVVCLKFDARFEILYFSRTCSTDIRTKNHWYVLRRWFHQNFVATKSRYSELIRNYLEKVRKKTENSTFSCFSCHPVSECFNGNFHKNKKYSKLSFLSKNRFPSTFSTYVQDTEGGGVGGGCWRRFNSEIRFAISDQEGLIPQNLNLHSEEKKWMPDRTNCLETKQPLSKNQTKNTRNWVFSYFF